MLAADSLRENAYTGQAELIRTNEDLTQSYFTINLAEANAGNEGENHDASKRDMLTIYTLDDIRQFGSVKYWGLYPKSSQLPLERKSTSV